MGNDIAIRFEHVTKSYGEREILNDFNMEIRRINKEPRKFVGLS